MSDINQENFSLNEQNGDSQPEESKKKLTDTQLRIVQVIAGILSAAALVVSMFIPSTLVEKGIIAKDDLLNYLFVVVFLAIMFGRRTIENKYRLRLGLYSLALINGILFGILIYVIRIFYTPESTISTLAEIYKILIIIGVVLVILVLGVLLPYLRYRKRVQTNTLPPIRIPEKKEDTHAESSSTVNDGTMSIEQKIAAMMADIDSPEGDEPKDSDDNAGK